MKKLLPTKFKSYPLLPCSALTTKFVSFSSQYRKHLHIYLLPFSCFGRKKKPFSTSQKEPKETCAYTPKMVIAVAALMALLFVAASLQSCQFGISKTLDMLSHRSQLHKIAWRETTHLPLRCLLCLSPANHKPRHISSLDQIYWWKGLPSPGCKNEFLPIC